MNLAQKERIALASTFREVGADAPTLCEGWTAKDLLVHLLIRENRPDAIGGLFIGKLQPRLDRVTHEYETRPFEELICEWEKGASTWNPVKYLDQFVNVSEHFVHHEDVLRARDAWEPRSLSPSDERELQRTIKMMSRPMLRKSQARVIMESPHGWSTIAGARQKDGQPILPDVRVYGEPGELLLWLFGREAVRVVFDGDSSLIERTAI
ncbi:MULTISPECIES: TIGR03085 family metal-binding protein [unclassified Corynebacterium]|uniref:TIGR03085 family metal-binding protein n=1 Tax=unclassified Corynebacterium TaxID=2624378 RepID=UPI0030A34F0A